MRRDEKIIRIASEYGYEAQSRQCIDEMAELTQAINKLWRKTRGKEHPGSGRARDHVAEELADVQIMIQQMAYLLGVEQLVETIIDMKLDHQIAKIERITSC